MSDMLLKDPEKVEETVEVAIEQFANYAKFKEMLLAANFSYINPAITSERFSVLDAYNQRPSNSSLVHPKKRVLMEAARQAVGEHKGTTAQFLKYLIDDQRAGMDFPIAHLDSECLNSDGFRCCLYVYSDGERRVLELFLLSGRFDADVGFFSAR